MRTAPGLVLGFLAAALFGTSGSFASALMDAGWSPAAATTARITGAALILTLPAALTLRGRWHVLRKALPSIAVFGVVAIGVAQLCYFNAVRHLSVSVALLMEYLGVVLVVGWMWLTRGLRPTKLTAAGAVLAIAGLLLVLDVFGGAHVNGAGLLWGLGAAVGLGVYFVLSEDQAEDEDESVPPLVVAWGGMVTAAVVLWAAAATGAVELHATFGDVGFAGADVPWFVPLAGLAIVAGVLAYVVGIAATRSLGATVSSFVGLLEVLFAALFAWLFLGEQPSLVQAAGGIVVLGGIVLVRLGELRRQPVEVPAPSPVGELVPA